MSFLESFQLDLSSVSQCGGHSVPRTHREPNAPDGKPRPVGWDIVSALRRHLEGYDAARFRLVTRARVSELLMEGSSIVGVVYIAGDKPEPVVLRAGAVVLTTGGFSADHHGLLRRHAPTLSSLPTTNGPFATGDGVRLAVAVGAAVRDMSKVCLARPSSSELSGPGAPDRVRGPGQPNGGRQVSGA